MPITRRDVAAAVPGLLLPGLLLPGLLSREARAEGASDVLIQPYGRALSNKDIAAVKAAITGFFDVSVEVLPRRPHPKAAWYPPRKRWRADVLLEDLAARVPVGTRQILGLTKADISVTNGPHKDWGVLGYGMIGGPACVVSRFRCRSGAKGAAHVRTRLAKVCLHELGHTLGSDHCPNPTCLMRDAMGKVKPLDFEFDFCDDTRKIFAKAGTSVREVVSPPWEIAGRAP